MSAVQYTTARAAGHCRTCKTPIARGAKIGIVSNKWHHRSCVKPSRHAPAPATLIALDADERLARSIAAADAAASSANLPARQRRLARLEAREREHYRQVTRNLAFYGERTE